MGTITKVKVQVPVCRRPEGHVFVKTDRDNDKTITCVCCGWVSPTMNFDKIYSRTESISDDRDLKWSFIKNLSPFKPIVIQRVEYEGETHYLWMRRNQWIYLTSTQYNKLGALLNGYIDSFSRPIGRIDTTLKNRFGLIKERDDFIPADE